jgi:uncharacterized protein
MNPPPAGAGPLDLLVLQPTPFCNIDCTYCYLPDRASTKSMSPEVLEHVFARVFESGLATRPFTVVWHAGEPLVLPPAYYERAFALLDRANAPGLPVWHSLQTNATLIDDAWCDFIRARGVRVGVSVDGPAFLHDRCRRTRQGRGTHERVVRGMRRLRAAGIPFHVITVLTRPSLDYPDELYEFYTAEGVDQVGFNVEEIEGPHAHSSLEAGDTRAALARFLGRFYDLAAATDPQMHVREFDGAVAALAAGAGGPPPRTHETTPLAIISVDCDGNFGTFSPELLGLPSAHYGGFALGRVQTDSFQGALDSPKLRAMAADVGAGVERCRRECAYFPFCGGGAPANKYFENGSFDSTETLFCRLTKQAVLDVVLDKLERPGAPPSPPPPGPARKAERTAGSRLSLL